MANSGPVSRERFACMIRRRPALDAQDSESLDSLLALAELLGIMELLCLSILRPRGVSSRSL